MNFFGLGPLEIFFILALGLVVLGPERLQQMGRDLGRLVGRFLAWQQTNPEAQMMQNLHREFQREIAELRAEVARARQQLDVTDDVDQLRQELRQQGLDRMREQSMQGENSPASQPALDNAPLPDNRIGGSVEPAPEPPAATPAPDSADPQPAAAAPAEPAAQPMPAPPSANGTPETTSEHELLARQLHVLVADMHALQEQLRARGLLAPEWEPPSQMIVPQTIAETEVVLHDDRA